MKRKKVKKKVVLIVDPLVQKVEEWIKKNSKAKLAGELGYTSTGSIVQWIKRGRIPPYMHKAVIKIISRKGEK